MNKRGLISRLKALFRKLLSSGDTASGEVFPMFSEWLPGSPGIEYCFPVYPHRCYPPETGSSQSGDAGGDGCA